MQNAVLAVLSQEGHPVLYLSRCSLMRKKDIQILKGKLLTSIGPQIDPGIFYWGRGLFWSVIISLWKNFSRSKVTSARLLRWAIHLTASDYGMRYVKGNTIPHVDALSRMKFDADDVEVCEVRSESFIHWHQTDFFSLQEKKRN